MPGIGKEFRSQKISYNILTFACRSPDCEHGSIFTRAMF